jgi:hypothetical protein
MHFIGKQFNKNFYCPSVTAIKYRAKKDTAARERSRFN